MPAVGDPRPAAPAALVFDGATVVDVAHGRLLPAQRVVVMGTRIRAVGSERSVRAPVMLRLPPGLSLHTELAMYVAEGLTPLAALQATLNPATFLHGSDSLGTIAPGKLADLVLLDADPLADIRNTMRISAVMANGRYFDRPALDRLLAGVKAKVLGTGPLGMNVTPRTESQ